MPFETALPSLHPAVLHFPIALGVVALGFDLAALAAPRRRWLAASGLVLTLLWTLATVATYLSGEEALESLGEIQGPASAAAWSHADAAFLALVASLVVLALRAAAAWRDRGRESVRRGAVRLLAMAAMVAALALLFRAADLGGALVYRHGLGVAGHGGPVAGDD